MFVSWWQFFLLLLLTHAAGTWDLAGLFFGRELTVLLVVVMVVVDDDEGGNATTDGEVGEGNEKVGRMRGNSMKKCQQTGREKRKWDNRVIVNE